MIHIRNNQLNIYFIVFIVILHTTHKTSNKIIILSMEKSKDETFKALKHSEHYFLQTHEYKCESSTFKMTQQLLQYIMVRCIYQNIKKSVGDAWGSLDENFQFVSLYANNYQSQLNSFAK